MKKHTHTTLARFPRLLLDRAEHLGLPRDKLGDAAGIKEEDLRECDARVPLTRFNQLWRAIIEEDQDPTIGIRLGSMFRIRDAGLVGYAMLHSATLGDAIKRFVDYSHIIEDTAFLTIESHEDRIHLTIEESPTLTGLRQPIEADLATCVTCAREITEVATVPEEVWFPYPAPDNRAPYREIFGGTTLKFETKKAVLVVSGPQLELPVVEEDETLCSYLDEHAASILETLKTDSFSEKVRRAIWNELAAGRLTLKSVASSMALSARTLQRRLREEGVTFAVLLERFRERMAVELLQRRDLAIYEVAYLLGYSEPSTFFRAFRRWKKMSPREFRAAMA